MNENRRDFEQNDYSLQSQLPLSALLYRIEDARLEAKYAELRRNKGEYQFLYWE